MARDMHLAENWQKSTGVEYTCLLTSVPSGGNLVWYFDPDPTVALWSTQMSTSPLPTRGGQVVYPGFRTIGPLLISGALRSRYDKFQLAAFVQAHHEEAIYEGKPLHFIYPERDWDFAVYINAFPEIGLNGEEGELTDFLIQADITRDHTKLEKVPLSDWGIPENIEWIDVEGAAERARLNQPQSGTDGGATADPSTADPEGDVPEGEEGAANPSDTPTGSLGGASGGAFGGPGSRGTGSTGAGGSGGSGRSPSGDAFVVFSGVADNARNARNGRRSRGTGRIRSVS